MNDLEKQVYLTLLRVPKGKVTTYSEIARAAGLKNGQRLVGRIMKKNPFPVIIPCHRVVKSGGYVGGYFFGSIIKEKMLTKEGIKIKDGKIQNWENSVFRF